MERSGGGKRKVDASRTCKLIDCDAGAAPAPGTLFTFYESWRIFSGARLGAADTFLICRGCTGARGEGANETNSRAELIWFMPMRNA